MQRNQINLNHKNSEENKFFLKGLYNSNDLSGVDKWFDKLENSIRREPDKDMSLDAFLGLINNALIALQIGSPTPDEIRYMARATDTSGIERFAWLICPLTEQNYLAVARLFQKSYKQDIETIKVPEALKEYHKRIGLL